MSKIRLWTREELLLTINLYFKIPFGKIHSHNQDIISLAKQLHRSPNALAMKLVNFASLDPIQQKRGIKGLRKVSKTDIEVWQEYSCDWGRLAYESQLLSLKVLKQNAHQKQLDDHLLNWDVKETEKQGQIKVRLVQRFFRDVTLANYESKCAFCSIAIPQLLVASHIIPWKDDVKRRADPTNGICLCALHDKAFDTGLLGISGNLKILVSPTIKKRNVTELHQIGLLEIEGNLVLLPQRFYPDKDALKFHREKIFIAKYPR